MRGRLTVPAEWLAIRWRRLQHHAYEWLTPLLGPLSISLAKPIFGDGELGWARRLPLLPAWMRRDSPGGRLWPGPEQHSGTPPALRTVAGIWRDPEIEQQAFEQAPLRDFVRAQPEATESVLRHAWDHIIVSAPRLLRSRIEIKRVSARAPRTSSAAHAPEQLTAMIRDRAAEVGLSTVGFAAYDPKYTYVEYSDGADENVIVCILEQAWAATQTVPSSRAERAAFQAYSQLNTCAASLAEYIQDLGYRARPHTEGGEAVVIHYAVQAGLGQLGLNGQLLTPSAGSRARISLITTNAPLVPGKPIDFGIHAICDRCQVCVRRCPVGAIPKTRHEHRGIVKAPIKPERCFPVVVHNHGCAICMKVCPIQRYGLPAVTEHLLRHDEILGKDSDELEGYVWPQDGRFYPAGAKPPIDSATINPPGWFFDKDRLPTFTPANDDRLADD
jgi:ferredoxin